MTITATPIFPTLDVQSRPALDEIENTLLICECTPLLYIAI